MDGSFAVKLSFELDVLRCEVEIQSRVVVLRQIGFGLDILRCEVEIQYCISCVASSSISFPDKAISVPTREGYGVRAYFLGDAPELLKWIQFLLRIFCTILLNANQFSIVCPGHYHDIYNEHSHHTTWGMGASWIPPGMVTLRSLDSCLEVPDGVYVVNLSITLLHRRFLISLPFPDLALLYGHFYISPTMTKLEKFLDVIVTRNDLDKSFLVLIWNRLAGCTTGWLNQTDSPGSNGSGVGHFLHILSSFNRTW
ncbi:hypothetical protein F3Y22_tig00111002pilonHSYRG00010 [Hibiscus syriacus]|uniref:Uncharacterized protein n=1 Tax=Hibiscus syriacus TaxID=106335 RepID=A0A6A2Z8V8_HIBSY|nr:hypothetical protein F3Y22_tig00111002pilonHSYRG00010 [Hibiscus syriacus]